MKKLTLKEFQREGFLLEVNRQFFHPLGLALTLQFEDGVTEIAEETEPIGLFIQDGRDDPEGYFFESLTDEIDLEKSRKVIALWDEKAKVRLDRFGWIIQPIGTK